MLANLILATALWRGNLFSQLYLGEESEAQRGTVTSLT